MAGFTVGTYQVTVWKAEGRWMVSVDEAIHTRWYGSEAQAAGAGLLRAQRMARSQARARTRLGAAGAQAAAAP
jgi:hypothetical protein